MPIRDEICVSLLMYLPAVTGLILYNGQKKGGDGDFVSLGLNNSYVEFRFDVGSGPAVIRSDHPIRIGEWHTVVLSRTKKQGTGQFVKNVTQKVLNVSCCVIFMDACVQCLLSCLSAGRI